LSFRSLKGFRRGQLTSVSEEDIRMTSTKGEGGPWVVEYGEGNTIEMKYGGGEGQIRPGVGLGIVNWGPQIAPAAPNEREREGSTQGEEGEGKRGKRASRGLKIVLGCMKELSGGGAGLALQQGQGGEKTP